MRSAPGRCGRSSWGMRGSDILKGGRAVDISLRSSDRAIMANGSTDSPAPRRRRLSSGALQRLEIAIRLADVADPAASTELRDAVREQAAHLRDQGEPTERVVSEIKREFAETLARTGALKGDEPAASALLDQVVRWASEARIRAD